MSDVRSNPVYKPLNKPLTILGVEKSLFFTAIAAAYSLFQFFDSLLSAVIFCFVFLSLARVVSAKDPKMLTFLLTSGRFRAEYDPCKYELLDIRRIEGRA
jgi:type IV secretory pathway VirB3-like protein